MSDAEAKHDPVADQNEESALKIAREAESEVLNEKPAADEAPDGGLDAWLCVVAASCKYVNSW